MNSPDDLLLLVQALTPASVVFSCERFFTAPLRALSPTGLFTAILVLPLHGRAAAMIGKSQPRAKVPHGSGGTIYPVALESFFVRWSLFVAFQRKKLVAIGVKAPLPGFIEPALASSIE